MSYWSKYPDIQVEMNKVEDLLQKVVKTKQKIVEEATSDLLQAGGKRVRPALTIISAKFGNYDSNRIVPLAAALELFHMATLIHDDIIDNAKMRRGVETAQSKYGKDIAVYTGDYLFSKAFLLVSQVDKGESVLQLAKFIKAICEGEIEQYSSKFNYNGSIVAYLKRIKYKTALLFALCCQVGAETADCDKKTVRNLRKYGMSLGTAFQLKDDLLDVTEDDKTIGKPAGKDIIEGVYTLPLLYSIKSSIYKQDVLNLLEKQQLTTKDVFELIRYMNQAGGIKYTQELENRFYQKAIESLKQVPKHANVKILEDLILDMKNRNK